MQSKFSFIFYYRSSNLKYLFKGLIQKLDKMESVIENMLNNISKNPKFIINPTFYIHEKQNL